MVWTVSSLVAIAAAAGGCFFDPGGVREDGTDDGGAMPGDAGPVPACMTSGDYEDRQGTDHRYRFVQQGAVYDQAYAACSADGAHLVVVDDQAENDYLAARVVDHTWIGLDDYTVEGEFVWVTGQPLAALHDEFKTGEPSDSATEDCTEMDGVDPEIGLWNDNNCDNRRDFVCECEPSYVAPAVPSCMSDPSFDIDIVGRRYRITGNQTWAAARATCEADGAYLVVIGDADENQAINVQLGNEWGWLGLDDLGTEGAFEWINGAPLSIQPWRPPNPEDGSGAGTQDCAKMYEDGSWDDDFCTATRMVVCECDPSGM